MLFDLKGESRPVALAKADRADAYKQLPLLRENEPGAVVTLRNPSDGLLYGLIPRSQLFGSAAAVLHYDCLSRVIASLTRSALKIPCVGYYDDFGIVLPECSIKTALNVFASFNKALFIIPKEKKSEFGAP